MYELWTGPAARHLSGADCGGCSGDQNDPVSPGPLPIVFCQFARRS